MATFSVRFVGCKVSYADAQAVRERLLGDASTAAVNTVPIEVKKERSARLRALSDELCLRRWASRVGSTDRVFVDRPGRGYGADYTPWLVDGEVGRLLPARAVGVSEEGILAVAA